MQFPCRNFILSEGRVVDKKDEEEIGEGNSKRRKANEIGIENGTARNALPNFQIEKEVKDAIRQGMIEKEGELWVNVGDSHPVRAHDKHCDAQDRFQHTEENKLKVMLNNMEE